MTHASKIQEMEMQFAAERQAMQEEKERALAELATEYEAKLAAAAKVCPALWVGGSTCARRGPGGERGRGFEQSVYPSVFVTDCFGVLWLHYHDDSNWPKCRRSSKRRLRA